MPTPNADPSPADPSPQQQDQLRPTRPQLACPEDIAPTQPDEEEAPATTAADQSTSGASADAGTPTASPPGDGEIPQSQSTDGGERAETSSPSPTPEVVAPASPAGSVTTVASASSSSSITSLPPMTTSPSTKSAVRKAPAVDGVAAAGKGDNNLGGGDNIETHTPWLAGPGYDISNRRVLPSYSSSYLRPGRTFVGKQTSDKSEYEVQVELKHVDMEEAFLCGYLRIKGLTDEHPTLTTYFEGEMISPRYSFQTNRPEWGSSKKTDFQHWERFSHFNPLRAAKKNPSFVPPNWDKREYIFMRWKEYFLVPDHRVTHITGASFEGFYYIMFNQFTGRVEGIYFHAKSEKYQKLDLRSEEGRGMDWRSCEFR